MHVSKRSRRISGAQRGGGRMLTLRQRLDRVGRPSRHTLIGQA